MPFMAMMLARFMAFMMAAFCIRIILQRSSQQSCYLGVGIPGIRHPLRRRQYRRKSTVQRLIPEEIQLKHHARFHWYPQLWS